MRREAGSVTGGLTAAAGAEGLERGLFRHRGEPWRFVSVIYLALASGSMAGPAVAMEQVRREPPSESAEASSDDAGKKASRPSRLLSTVVVSAGAASVSAKARAELEQVPGGVAVIDQSSVLAAKVATSADILAYQPGVYAQSAGGNDGLKISIRGSSINRGTGYFRSGLLMLFDGLPVTGPGGTPYELFEPLGLDHTEILRGANGFDLGTLTLGGTINYVTTDGRHAPPLAIRLEGGSYGYGKQQVAVGGHDAHWDYYLSLTHSERTGYQALTRGRSRGLVANLGYRFNALLETRLYLRWRNTFNGAPGDLTLAQIRSHPRQANPLNRLWGADRHQPGSIWLGSKTTLHLDQDSELDIGWVWHRYPIDSAANIYSRDIWHFSDVSAVLSWRNHGEIFGRPHDLRAGILSTRNLSSSEDSTVRIATGASAGWPTGSPVRRSTYGGGDHTLHLSENVEWIPDLHLIAGLSGLYSIRRTAVVRPFVNQPYRRERLAWAPRFGLTWDLPTGIQLYGNFSRSVQTPDSWAILSPPPAFSHGPATGWAIRGLDLQNQRASTVELGARGDSVIGSWSADIYRSAIRHELLSVQLQAATATQTEIDAEYNAAPTLHQGIEAGLQSWLAEGPRGRLQLVQAYTWSDFHYRGDIRFGHHQLPGLPRHFYQARLRYLFAGGFYLGASTQLASRMPADYANSLFAPGYAIFGAEMGYQPARGPWSAFLDLHNLGNRHYAPIVTPGYDDQGRDAPRFQPGDGLTAYVGVSWHLQ